MMCVLSHLSHVRLFVTLRTAACQAPLSMGFSRQEYSSRGSSWPRDRTQSPTLQADSSPLIHQGSLQSPSWCLTFPQRIAQLSYVWAPNCLGTKRILHCTEDQSSKTWWPLLAGAQQFYCIYSHPVPHPLTPLVRLSNQIECWETPISKLCLFIF